MNGVTYTSRHDAIGSAVPEIMEKVKTDLNNGKQRHPVDTDEGFFADRDLETIGSIFTIVAMHTLPHTWKAIEMHYNFETREINIKRKE